MAEVIEQEVIDRLPPKEFVELVSERDKNGIIRWVVALFFAQLLGQTSLILIIGNMLWGR
ncbi:MAG: hypothetical protein ACREH3_17025 [Geminicoccales bacterium]